MTPLLILGIGLPPLSAISTDVVFAVAVKLFAVQRYIHFKNPPSLSHLRKILPPVVIGSLSGSLILIFLREKILLLEYTLSIVLCIALVSVSFTIFFRNTSSRFLFLKRPWRPFNVFIVTALVSALVPLTSVGSGALLLPLLVLVYRIDSSVVVPTSLALGLLILGMSMFTHIFVGQVQWSILPYLILGAIPGIWFGTKANTLLNPLILERVLAVTLLLSGIRLVIR